MTTETASAHPPLTSAEIRLIDAWWRAANYLSRARAYTREVGDHMPEVRDWIWPGA